VCGIVAIYSKDPEFSESSDAWCQRVLPGMLHTLRYRGPDDSGIRRLGATYFGHTRLSIIDLPGGQQPLYNEDESIGLICNGEIYNHEQLKRELKSRGHVLRTGSDCETIIHLYEDFGAELFDKLEGMFAFVLYDRNRHRILAGRDRAGEKPLLMYQDDEIVIFASEAKAILASGRIPPRVHPDALALYLNTMFVPAPLTIFEGITKIKPSHYCILDGRRQKLVKYWHPRLQALDKLAEGEIATGLTTVLTDIIGNKTTADVPVGVFLSGGLDSSAVTALVASASSEPVKSYTVGFPEGNDERGFAAVVARRFRTQHTELVIDRPVRDVIAKVLEYYDEPFADSSAVPTYMIAELARRDVKVILTGDGGDELFAGYPAYVDQKYQIGNRPIAAASRLINQALIRTLHCDPISRMGDPFGGRLSRQHWRQSREVVSSSDLSRWIGRPTLDPQRFFASEMWFDVPGDGPLSQAFAFDINYYLPDDLLKKVDMSCMLASLECRAPLLDHRVIEYAMSIPPGLKIRQDSLKSVFKRALRDLLPPEIIARPKQGFGLQRSKEEQASYLEMVGDLLGPGCRAASHVNPTIIEDVRTSACGGFDTLNFRSRHHVWLLFCLEWWLRTYGAA
jgi:asparagine synthase (glutamine-hydrolysing)